MKRKFEVTLSVDVMVEIDDEAVSEWDGKTVLAAHENPERWAKDFVATLGTSIGAIAQTVGLYGSRDGWADFPDEAIRAHVSGASVEAVYDEDGVYQ